MDGRNLIDAAGKTTLWADDQAFRAVRASAPGMVGGKQFERTVALIAVSDRACYMVDLFRLVGGSEHVKFLYGRLGTVTTQGLTLQPGEPFGRGAQMRNFQQDAAAKPGWSADWKIDDRHNLLPKGTDVPLRCTDLTTGAQAWTAEGWVLVSWDTSEAAWIPWVMVRRRAEKGPLASTFVGVLEPYEKQSSINRLALASQDGKALAASNVAVEGQLADGSRDLLVAADVEEPPNGKTSGTSVPILLEKDRRLRVEGEIGFVRLDRDGKIARLALCRGRAFQVGDFKLQLKERVDFIEMRFDEKGASVLSGDHRQIEEISR